MVIDGNPRALRGLIQQLQQIPGISAVGVARDASTALSLVVDKQPDVVVLDPRHVASDTAKFLRQIAAAAPRARIVILTAYLTEQERADLMHAGTGTIVLKEIDLRALVQAIVPHGQAK